MLQITLGTCSTRNMTNHDIIKFLEDNNPITDDPTISIPIVLNQMCEMGMIDKNPDGTYSPTQRGNEIFLEYTFGSNN